MDNDNIVVKDLIDRAFTKINQYRGANYIFYERFSKSRAVVSTWKSGKVIPSQKDISEFLSVSNQLIKEMQESMELSKLHQAKLMEEFQSLISE
jgi:hypothetical protein